ncbi:fungal-specific transcription factor domain-containing protein [Penicillium subrubescens]|uniref:Uncharacterized protein n=1 Tax=Penicillium subrubescens TaxID=1316194 RepID=A0A1Q5T622_9EURO|nr:fungal-specific transcription factor domain-containing protein [Penicillium subrubescens]KAJ5896125.1 fungal-specific transcription factor domain-containing protein [Penicillium subrubescens]OKO95683.1 hypothetical protein PENSUB_11195 [Penicillium subrubescens]
MKRVQSSNKPPSSIKSTTVPFTSEAEGQERQLVQPALPPFESEVITTEAPGMGADPWTTDFGSDTYWAFMPFLSQLETLPGVADIDIDIDDLE